MIQFDDQVTLKVKATLNHNYELKRHPITLNTSLMQSTVSASTFLYQIGLNLHFNRAPPSQPIWRQTRIFRSNSHRWCVRIICVYKLSVCTNRQCVYERISRHSSTGQLIYLEKCMLSIVEKQSLRHQGVDHLVRRIACISEIYIFIVFHLFSPPTMSKTVFRFSFSRIIHNSLVLKHMRQHQKLWSG